MGSLAGTSVDSSGALHLVYGGTNVYSKITGTVKGGNGHATAGEHPQQPAHRQRTARQPERSGRYPAGLGADAQLRPRGGRDHHPDPGRDLAWCSTRSARTPTSSSARCPRPLRTASCRRTPATRRAARAGSSASWSRPRPAPRSLFEQLDLGFTQNTSTGSTTGGVPASGLSPTETIVGTTIVPIVTGNSSLASSGSTGSSATLEAGQSASITTAQGVTLSYVSDGGRDQVLTNVSGSFTAQPNLLEPLAPGQAATEPPAPPGIILKANSIGGATSTHDQPADRLEDLRLRPHHRAGGPVRPESPERHRHGGPDASRRSACPATRRPRTWTSPTTAASSCCSSRSGTTVYAYNAETGSPVGSFTTAVPVRFHRHGRQHHRAGQHADQPAPHDQPAGEPPDRHRAGAGFDLAVRPPVRGLPPRRPHRRGRVEQPLCHRSAPTSARSSPTSTSSASRRSGRSRSAPARRAPRCPTSSRPSPGPDWSPTAITRPSRPTRSRPARSARPSAPWTRTWRWTPASRAATTSSSSTPRARSRRRGPSRWPTPTSWPASARASGPTSAASALIDIQGDVQSVRGSTANGMFLNDTGNLATIKIQRRRTTRRSSASRSATSRSRDADQHDLPHLDPRGRQPQRRDAGAEHPADRPDDAAGR